MYKNNRKKHLFHLVNYSARAFIISINAFLIMSGLAFGLIGLKPLLFQNDLLFICLFNLVKNIKRWYNEIISESTFAGYHTLIVQFGLKFGFILFIISEIMLFAGFFWAFFHFSLSPDTKLGLIWPPTSILVVHPLDIPLFNTLLLLFSGFSLTWMHISLVNGLVYNVCDSWLITMCFGLFFLFFQLIEYYESPFSFNDSCYGSSFFMLTGLHGMHVTVGIIAIFICFHRYMSKHFLSTHHIGFLFAAWYWHFVDIVWILLFLIVYIWGGGFVFNIGTTGPLYILNIL